MLRSQSPSCLIALIATVILVGLCGCRAGKKVRAPKQCPPEAAVVVNENRVEYANVDRAVGVSSFDIAPPLTSATELPEESFPLTLDEAIQIAFENTLILRDLGARVLQNPEFVASSSDPAIQSTDPNFGIEAALSEFDAQFTSGLTYEKNDGIFNNDVIAGGSNQVQQGLTTGTFGLSKISATGTRFALRGNFQNDINNRPNNLFDNSWTTLLEAEMRQPLLQGRGVEFNRIAGPNGQPGLRFSNGVLISRINNDISIAQFERNIRQFVDDVINAYWQLYLAYRSFEAAKVARDGAQETWNTVKARFDNDLPGGEADREAQAREQYFVFQGQLIDALNGNNQSATPGVLQAESDLRRLLNIPQSDGRLIRPIDQPSIVEVAYDWHELAHHALNCRVELREQEWRMKRRELELLAARNFTQPRLDAVATYRNNGFGDDFWGGGNVPFSSALDVATDRDYEEWEFGFQMNVPIGFRQASAGVRNAELNLERERRVLEEQQRQILHELGSAIRGADRTFASVQIARSRLAAARETVAARKAAFEAEAAPFDEYLDAQRRLADAEVAYHQETIEWSLATESVLLESGALLTSHMVFLNEAPSSNPAEVDIANRRQRFQRKRPLDYRLR